MNEPSKTIVIGAGPAGLAVAASLKQVSQSAVVLEQAPNVGSAWRNHYDWLHLQTPKSLSALPYEPFPEYMPRHPSRAQWVQPQLFGVIEQIRSQHKIPLIDVGTIDMIKKGRIHVGPGIERFTPGGVRFSDGQAQDFDSVICATGYRSRVNTFVQRCEAAFDAVGTPLTSGHETLPSLYFCGFFVSPSGMLCEIAQEAGQIAASIVRSR